MPSKYDFTWNTDFFDKPKKKNGRSVLSALGVVVSALILASLTLIAMSGCEADNGKRPPEGPVSPPASPDVPKERGKDLLSYEVQIGTDPAPNKYIVILTWNQGAQPWPWAVRRDELKSKTSPALIKVGDRGVYFDTSAEPGKTYKYVLGSMHGDDFLRSAEKEVTVPEDLVVRGTLALGGTQKFNRIFFEENSTLTTNGNPLQLSVTEIISQWGAIETFPANQKAATGTNGRTPGQIRIIAQSTSGRLRVIARGENGGDGADGRPGTKGVTGAPGANGHWGMNPELYKRFTRQYVDFFKQLMERNPKPPGDPAWKASLAGGPRFVCETQPTDGAPGGPGGPGGDGGDGGKGGDSGSIYITVTEESGFEVSILSEPGKAGLSGRFGRGGEGGAGGPPGALDPAHLCQPAREGNRGEPGIDGHQGRFGSIGSSQPACTKIGKRSTGDCSKFE